jgi:cyclin B
MLIATKYEEIYPPLLKDLVFITDNVFTADEILEMELDILVALDFNIQLTTSYRFLERFSKITKIDSVTFFIA